MVIGCLVVAGQCVAAPPVPSEMVQAAQAFVASLDAAQKAEACFPFNSEVRFDWHFVPRERPGVALEQLSDAQKDLAIALIGTALSEMGMKKVANIRELEIVLREMGGGPHRNPDHYDVAVFGDPDATGTWGLRFEGHHISLNWTVVKGQLVATTPQFFGSNPADVLEGSRKGLRALASEEDLGRALVHDLSEAQRAQAMVSDEAPRDILTGAAREAAIQENSGIPFSALSEDQQGMLLALIEVHAEAQRPDVANARFAAIKEAGLDDIRFAWMGSITKFEPHYYRIQGTTFLIEYDNIQNNANHIHTVWREFAGDWGLDVLKQHYAAHADPDHPHTHDH